MIPEEKILTECRKGDRKAQAELYKRFSRLMFGVCQRYSRSREDAEDVLHIAFVKVFNNLGQYHGKGSLEGWIRKVMVNTAIDHYRSSVKQQFISIDDVRELQSEEEPELADSEKEEDQFLLADPNEILKLMQQLPHGYRLVLNLYAIENQNHKEIAEMLGITEGSSKSQLFKARRYLKALMIEKKLVKQIESTVYEKG